MGSLLEGGHGASAGSVPVVGGAAADPDVGGLRAADGSLMARVALPYLRYIFSRESRCIDYVSKFFQSRGLVEDEWVLEARRLAAFLDDAILIDHISLHTHVVERLARRLYGIETAIVTGRDELADVFDLDPTYCQRFRATAADAEVGKRFARARRIDRYLRN